MRHRKLLEKITHRGPKAFKQFLSILNVSFPEAHQLLEIKHSGMDRSLHNRKFVNRTSEPHHIAAPVLVPISQPIQPSVPLAFPELVPHAVPQPVQQTVSKPNPATNSYTNGRNGDEPQDVPTNSTAPPVLPRIINPSPSPIKPSVSYQNSRDITPIDVSDGLVLEPYTKEINSRKQILVKSSTMFYQSGKISTYDMKSQNRGVLFLVNIINFDKRPTRIRNGASVDRDNLISLFRQMGFLTFYYEDITKAVSAM